ncbi:hypothetical protein L1049_018519 [Liquidambar formosana]|uniref:FLZ-type domain-containing protein n=1 Tax=Liquidambar formosana TaxID=63359 RepID=A0AAP0RA75_LIQFO
MPRKRSRSVQKDQNMGHLTMSDTVSESYFQSDVLGPKHKSNSFFNITGLFVGLSPKGLSDCDSVRSPTSPLDFRVFSNIGNHIRSPRSSHEGHQKSWDCSKVGLSIIDSLADDTKVSGDVIRSSESKNIIFGPQMRIRTPKFQNHIDSFETPKSLPKNYAIFPHTQIKSSNLRMGNPDSLFEIGEDPFEPEPFGKIRSCSLDSGSRSYSSVKNSFVDRKPKSSSGNFCLENRTAQVSSPPQFIGGSPNSNHFSHSKLTSVPISIESTNGFIGSLSASEIELSEDYTCVISHGPNPKTTHIYGDCILKCHTNGSTNSIKHEEQEIDMPPAVNCSEISSSYPSNGFLSFCYSCNKKLEGEDIYMYRGEKAFCSLSCRAAEILIDEEMENTTINDSSENFPKNHGDELPQTGMFIAT